jgi:hypothetical protein
MPVAALEELPRKVKPAARRRSPAKYQVMTIRHLRRAAIFAN